MVTRWLDWLLTGSAVKSGAGSLRLRRARFPAQLVQVLSEDGQFLADGVAQHVGLAEVARDQAFHLGLMDEGIQLIVQRLVDLDRDADQRGLGR